MRIAVKSADVGKLKDDARTLEDIAKVLDADGQYKVLPSILNGIADDIRLAFGNLKGGGGDDV